MLAINLKTLWPWITTYSVCNKSVFLGSQKNHKNCKQKSFLFFRKTKSIKCWTEWKGNLCVKERLLPHFPPSQHESRTMMIPQSTSYTSLPMAFLKNPSEIIHTVLIGGFKSQIIAKKVLAIDSLCHPDDMSIHEAKVNGMKLFKLSTIFLSKTETCRWYFWHYLPQSKKARESWAKLCEFEPPFHF